MHATKQAGRRCRLLRRADSSLARPGADKHSWHAPAPARPPRGPRTPRPPRPRAPPRAPAPAPAAYLVRGKPRSTLLVPGSGQRDVTIFERV